MNSAQTGMKVLHINWQIWPDFKGGHVVHVRNLIKSLGDYHMQQAYLYTADGKDGGRPAIRKEEREGITFYEIVNNPHDPFATMPQFDLAYRPLEDLVGRAIEDFQPDIVHIHHLIQIPAAIINIIKAKYDLPVVVTVRDYWYLCPFYSLINEQRQICDPKERTSDCTRCFLVKNNMDREKTGHYAWQSEFEKRKKVMIRELNRADLITFVSDYLRKYYIDSGIDPAKAEVITAGSPFTSKREKQMTGKKQGPFNLAFLGTATEIKGTNFVLESLREWKGPDINVHFWGPLADPDRFSLLAQEKENVHIISHGPYEREDLQTLLEDMDVGLVPSLWPDTAPQVIFDFFACGMPVIASRTGGIPDFVRHKYNGLLFEPGNKEQFLGATEEIIENSALMKTLLKNIALPKTFHAYAGEIHSEYARLLGGKREKEAAAIELGGGETPHRKAEGFLNVDFRDIPEVDVVADIKILPFDSHSIQKIYCSNVAEHFERAEIKSVLIEWWRVLSPGGSIDIVVPDLENLMDSWRELPFYRVLDALYGAQKFSGDYHYNGFTEHVLREALEHSGFRSFPVVRKYVFDNVPRLWVRAQKKLKIVIYPLGDKQVASSRVRMLSMYPFLAERGYDVELSGQTGNADIVLIQKRFDPHLFASGRTTILDMDDNYFDQGENQREFQEAASRASAVVVSTRHLADHARQYNENVYLIPTGLDSPSGKIRRPDLKEKIEKVAWVGFPENTGYLNKVLPLIRRLGYRLCAVTRKTAEVDLLIRENSDVLEFHEWDLETVDDILSSCDIGIAPLDTDSWSQSKSSYKILKYWSLGIPVVCDSSPAYRDTEGEFGVRCIADDLGQWEERLQMPYEARTEQVFNAQKHLHKYSPGSIAALWDSVIGEVIRNRNSAKPYKEIQSSLNEYISSISNKPDILTVDSGKEIRTPVAKDDFRAVAFYLPQFHPIPENDAWWGKGFTEWTNVSQAKPLFDGHAQPRVPADLGYYDLRLPEARYAQAELARQHGIEGFCYWHYWFSGKRLLEKPFNQVLESGEPDLPFCLAWANETWSRRWLGEEKNVLMKQTYGDEDDINHIRWLSRAFSDPRYIRMDNRPVFLIYRPHDLPDARKTTDVFREECVRLGLSEPYLVGINAHCRELDCRCIGFDHTLDFTPQLGNLPDVMKDGPSEAKRARNMRFGVKSETLKLYDYAESLDSMLSNKKSFTHPVIPSVFVGWDNTPRRKENAVVILNSTPEKFGKALLEVTRSVQDRPFSERFVFINAWNEWAEGNYLEPDTRHGLRYLEEVKRTHDILSGRRREEESSIVIESSSEERTKEHTGSSAIQAIAFYLPQYHPIPENDQWWGEGFTEWTNVRKAIPLFDGHYQPHVPDELGYYDLRSPAARKKQADLAKEYGISGFCYYHYWFHGKRLLHIPIDEVLASGEPDFPFCLCWANEKWTRVWDGERGDILIDQTYSEEDDLEHIRFLCTVFQDKRYIRIDGKPLFLVYRANQLPDPRRTTALWREEARKRGIGEIYLCRVESFSDERSDPNVIGFDAAVEFQPDWTRFRKKLAGPEYSSHNVYDYEAFVKRMLRSKPAAYRRYPCVTPAWDNSPRRRSNATVFVNSSPEFYGRWLSGVVKNLSHGTDSEKIVFLNAWNEWAEGNHLEPDKRYGRAYLEATRRALLQGSPDDSVASRYEEVMRLAGQGLIEDAVVSLKDLLKKYPDFAVGYNDLGVLYFQMGDHRKSLEHYERAVQLNPENVTFRKNLADFYYMVAGRPEDAVKSYMQVLKSNPEDTEVLLALGRVCTALDRHEDAAAFYRKILELDPGNSIAEKDLESLPTAREYPGEEAEPAPSRKSTEVADPHPTVTVIIPVSENLPSVHACLKSLLKCTEYDAYKIVLVQSGPAEATQKYFESVKKNGVESVVFPENTGIADCCNAAAEMFQSDYYLFMDPGALPTKGWFAHLYDVVRAPGKVDAVTAKIVRPSGEIIEAGYTSHDSDGLRGSGERSRFDDPRFNCRTAIPGGSRFILFVSREAWTECGRFDARISSLPAVLMDMGLSLNAKGRSIWYQPKAVLMLRETGKDIAVDEGKHSPDIEEIDRLRPSPAADVPCRQVGGNGKQKNVLVLGIYLADRLNNVEDTVRILSASEGYAVTQRWVALNGEPPSQSVADVTVSGISGKKPKFEILNDVLAAENPDQYEYVVIVDDDIVLPCNFIDRFVRLQARLGFAIAQPARTENSYIDHPIVMRHRGLRARETCFVEIGPVVSIHRSAYDLVFPFDLASPMGWGYENVWSYRIKERGMKMGIIDAVSVDHSLRKPVANYDWSEADRERSAFLAKHPHVPIEECFTVLNVTE